MVESIDDEHFQEKVFNYITEVKTKLQEKYNYDKLHNCMVYSLSDFMDILKRLMQKFNQGSNHHKSVYIRQSTKSRRQIADDTASFHTKISIYVSKPKTSITLANTKKTLKLKKKLFFVIIIIILCIGVYKFIKY